MIARAVLIKWCVAASLVASHGLRALPDDVAAALVDEVLANPLTPTDAGIRTTLGIGTAVAWMEGHNQLSPTGFNDGGQSACWAQVYLPGGAKTAEGWTANELRTDPVKCAHVAVRLIKASVLASPTCDGCELVVYARGRDTEEGRRLSRHRVALAKRLIREVPLEVQP